MENVGPDTDYVNRIANVLIKVNERNMGKSNACAQSLTGSISLMSYKIDFYCGDL